MVAAKLLRHLIAFVALLVVLAQPAAVALALGEDREVPAWKVPSQPRIGAAAAVLMDFETGRLLYARNAHQPRDPASTTKVLTAIIALEEGDLDAKVTVSKRAAYTPGSSMYIKPGEVYSLHDLLHGLLMRSGNDAAAAIAEHLAGSVEAFAVKMNETAKKLGAKNSHFVNPHGLTVAGHYSTAYDLAVITRHALNNPRFAAIVSQKNAQLTYEYLKRDVVLNNTNRLLYDLPDADGVKTGTTAAAGACLIASATRDEHKLIAVVLRAGNRWYDSRQLLEWGYKNFRLHWLGKKGEILTSAPVTKGKPGRVDLVLAEDVAIITPREGPIPRLEVEVDPNLAAPIQQGQAVGRVMIVDGGVRKPAAPVLAASSVPQRTWLDTLLEGIRPLVRWLSEA